VNSETYKPFIYLIFNFFFSGSGELQITETTDTELAHMGARMYFVFLGFTLHQK
jgi:hypothetical protein